jgi:hypothetical protein
MDETSRRSFVKLMGASTALAGFGVSCSRPLEHLVPYNDHVEWVIPGKALFYSSAKPRLGGLGCDPLVVTTYEGRPTKVDGNRLHPAVNGGSSAFTQASILELYDQDRSKGYLKKGAETTRAEFEAAFLAPFREAKSGAKAGMLVSESTSPTRRALLDEAVEFEAINPHRAASGSGLDDPVKPQQSRTLVIAERAVGESRVVSGLRDRKPALECGRVLHGELSKPPRLFAKF